MSRATRRRGRGGQPHACHLSTVHPADDTRVFWREASGLAERGFRVTLVARADHDDVRNGVSIVAMPTYSSRIKRMTIGVLKAVRIAFRTKADVYHAHDPELLPALTLLRLAGKTVVYDAHELLSGQITSKPYLPAYVRWPAATVARALEWFAGKAMHRVVTVSQACAAPYPPRKVSIVANYPELVNFGAGSAESESGERQFCYVGGLTAIRGAQQIVDAIGQVVDGDGSHDAVPASLLIVGSFAPAALQTQVAERAGWQHVDFAGMVPHDGVAARVGRSVAGIATFLPTANNLIGSPNKLFEYMAMGLPVIISDFPAWRAMLDAVDCAYFVDPEDPAAIAGAMRAVLADPERSKAMGAAGRAAVEDTFNWEKQLDNLVDAYRRIGVTAS